MRLICTLYDKEREKAFAFAYYLASQGIENQCEEVIKKGEISYRIWIYDEDNLEKALALYQEYQANPEDPRYRTHSHAATRLQYEAIQGEEEEQGRGKKTPRFLTNAPYGPVSITLLVVVISLFITAHIQRKDTHLPIVPGIIQAPHLAPIEEKLLYDYPRYFILRDFLYKIYTPDEIEQKNAPSLEARRLIDQLQHTPVWMGIYEQFLSHFRNPNIPFWYKGPLFEKIRKGEIWRLFTPSLLHIDLIHIFFNVLWFILLGNQIEFRLGWWRYLLLILITGILSNTAQYLVSGTFFMGLSGIVVGMAAFIWARQQVAPWEGYLLQRLTFIFLAIFVIGMFVLQIVLFIMQLIGTLGPTIGIANTAHLVGAIVGYLLGRLPLFTIRPKIY
jgi:GlpG protein